MLPPMHEMSLASALLDIIRQEMHRHGASKLLCAQVRCGALAGVAPGALSLGFEALTAGTDLQGARLELIEEPLQLACGACDTEFFPEALPTALFAPCPVCSEEIGHRVLAGKALYLDNLTME